MVGGGHIFLVRGKYATNILKIFHLEDCRPMTIPMVTNWKKLQYYESVFVDPRIYHQLISSLM